MINIANFKVLKGYEHWKTVFVKEDFVKMREEAGGNILAKGFDAQNERVYVVQEMASMEVIQNAMAKNQERIKEAFTCLKEGLKQISACAEIYMNLGLVYEKQNEFEKAIQNFEMAIKHNPEYSLINQNIANLHELHGRYNEALKAKLKFSGFIRFNINSGIRYLV